MPRSREYSDLTDAGPTPRTLDPDGPLTPVLTPNEARQGTTRHNVWRILVISLTGVIVAFAVVYVAFF